MSANSIFVSDVRAFSRLLLWYAQSATSRNCLRSLENEPAPGSTAEGGKKEGGGVVAISVAPNCPLLEQFTTAIWGLPTTLPLPRQPKDTDYSQKNHYFMSQFTVYLRWLVLTPHYNLCKTNKDTSYSNILQPVQLTGYQFKYMQKNKNKGDEWTGIAFMLIKPLTAHRPHWNLGEQRWRRIWRQTSSAGLRNWYKSLQFYVFSVSVHIPQSPCATTFAHLLQF